MLDKYILISTVLFLGMGVALFAAFLPLLLIQHFIYKKLLDPYYFNNNHFNLYELSIFNSFPLFFMKTLAYVRAIVFPKTMLKRFKERILIPKENPFVYFIALTTMLIIIYSTIVLINTAVMAVFFYINK